MQWKDDIARYGAVTRLLHGVMSFLIIIQISVIYIKRLGLPPKDPLGNYLIGQIHKPLGILIWLLGISFVLWRQFNPKVRPVISQPRFEQGLALITHLGLYAIILLMPISGLAMSGHKGQVVPFFFGLTFDLSTLKGLAPWGWSAHSLGATVLFGLLGLHLIGVIKHQCVYKDSTLRRMMSFKGG